MTGPAIPRADRLIELDVLCAVVRYYSWQDRLPQIVTAAYDPDTRYLGRALVLLVEHSNLHTVYTVRIDGRLVPLDEAMGAPDADVVLTIPFLREALIEVGAPNPDRLVAVCERALQDASVPTDRAVAELVELAREREIMQLCADVHRGIGSQAGDEWHDALRRLGDLAAVVAA